MPWWVLFLAVLFGIGIHWLFTVLHPYCINCSNVQKRQGFWDGLERKNNVPKHQEEPESDVD